MMSQPLFMGIDGGGSKLRVAIVNAELGARASVEANSANPSLIGRAEAAKRIRAAVLQALHQAYLEHERIAAAGIGIAGASNRHSDAWLRAVMQPILPKTRLVASSDLEIALVGALAQRHGILLLAGAGSAAYGLKPGGANLQVGGWGYLLGDEGGGFWIGARLLRHVSATFDAGGELGMTALSQACLDDLGLSNARELVAWVYRSEEPPVARVASLAPYVMERAEAGDEPALIIMRCAAKHLARQAETLRRRLDYADAPFAFAGGLLERDNWLSREVGRRLRLPARPLAKYPPVIGAALLAKLEWNADRT